MFRIVFLLVVAILPIHAEDARMQAMDRALGVECHHCHTGEDWKRADNPEFSFAVRMIKMTDGLSAGTLRPLGGITCWTCHRGNVKPARMPRASWENVLAKWPEELKLSPQDAKKLRREVFKNIQSTGDAPAGGLPMAMSVFAAALGVGCEHCHIPGHWDSDEKPAKVTTRLMLSLFDEMPHYFEDSRQPVMQCYSCHQGSAKPERR